MFAVQQKLISSSVSVKTFFFSSSSNSLHSSRVVNATRATTVSRHLGAPWYCNHITVVPLLPSVVYRNCKQRGICDLEFWILRDAALLTLKAGRPHPHICVMLSSWKHIRSSGEDFAALLYGHDSHRQGRWRLSLLPQCLEREAQPQV